MVSWIKRWFCSHDDEIFTAQRIDRVRPHDHAGRPITVFRCKKCGRTRWIWDSKSR